MPQTVREVMTTDPVTVQPSDSAVQAARAMRDHDTGAIVVADGDQLHGLVTDRDIVVRAVAEGRDPNEMQVGEICSGDLVTVSPDDPVDQAIQAMRGRNVRRVPVVESGRTVGIVSLGDLAMERDEDSVLADISSAPPNT